MSLLQRFKDLTTGTKLRTILSSLIIALLIPITLFANTQRWELRKEAAERPASEVMSKPINDLILESLPATPPSGTTGDIKTAVLMFNFANDRQHPFTKEEIEEVVFDGPYSVNSYCQEVSFNQLSFSGDVFGWFELEQSNANCETSFQAWAEEVQTLASAQGINLEAYDRIAYLFPFVGSCPFGGIAGQKEIWVNGMNAGNRPDSHTFIHELGHTFGLPHSNSIRCDSKAIDDYSNCQVKEKGDVIDIMGESGFKYHLNAPNKDILGWVPSDRIEDITTTGEYRLYPLEAAGSGPQILRIRKPNTNQYYYLEYRQPIGFDSELPQGIRGTLIHIWNKEKPFTNGVLGPLLVDPTPETHYKADYALTDGKSFYDEINGITIVQTSHNTEYASITIDLPPTPECPASGTNLYPGVGKAAYFDGYSNIEISSPNNLSGKNDEDFTIEAWVNLEPRENVFEYLFTRKSLETSRQTYRLFFYLSSQNQAANLRFAFGSTTAEGGSVQSDYSIPFGEWVHVGAAKEGSILKIFINGQLAGSAPFVDIDDSENSVNWVGGLGVSDQNVPYDAFRGFIDDLRVSDAVRNIEENWANGVYSEPLVADENTLALWRFEGNFEDSSPNRNDGTELGNVLLIECGECVPESLLPGDLDCDCDVDIVDIVMVATIWNTQEGNEKFRPEFDFDDDGRISIVDIMYIAAKWGTECP